MNNTALNEQTKIKISERALCQRINRKLKPDCKRLCSPRGMNSFATLGRYYVLDTWHNFIVDGHVDLDYFGRKLGVLHEWEELA